MIIIFWILAILDHHYGFNSKLTAIPRAVLVKNRYRKSPMTRSPFAPLSLVTSIFWIALNRTTDVASFTTPSPKTRLYSKGVSSRWRTYIWIECHSTSKYGSGWSKLNEREHLKHDKPAVYTLYQLMKKLFLQLFQNKMLM